MQIQVEKVWLFETQVTNPIFLGTKDGITTTLLNPRTINLLDIVSVYFYFDTIARAGLTYNIKYGGEDDEIQESYGKTYQDYTLEVNMPTVSQNLIEKLIGKEFALAGMRRDLSRFAIFGRFICQNLSIDNEVQQRVRFEAKNSQARMFNVQSFNIEQIENIIDPDLVDDLNQSFDYTLDFSV